MRREGEGKKRRARRGGEVWERKGKRIVIYQALTGKG
jgi:hypothetical protein